MQSGLWIFLARTWSICRIFLHKSTPYMYTQLRLSVWTSYQSLDAIESPHYPGDMREGVMTLALYAFLCAIGCQLWANACCSNQPIWTQPKVLRDHTEHKYPSSNTVWGHGPQYAPPVAAYIWGHGIGGKMVVWNGHVGPHVATPNQHIWTQPSVSNQSIVPILNLEIFGGHKNSW